MVARVTRRLPGFKFEARSPRLDEALPRMDIAVFVGFAASGPLHIPVAIDDAEQFAEVFGKDAPLAWDAERCRQVSAQLGPAVRGFFRNGGRRCWVIRVAADDAESNIFPIPGLAMAELDPDGNVARVSPAFARARSEGSWSDSLRSASALLTKSFEALSVFRADGSAEGFPKNSLAAELRASAGDVVIGDLLRLSFNNSEGATLLIAMLVVEAVAAAPDSPPTDRGHLVVGCTREVWLKPANPGISSVTTNGSAQVFVRARENQNQESPVPLSEEFEAQIHWPDKTRDELEVLLRTSIENAPPAGSVVLLKDSDGIALMTVSDSGPGDPSTFGASVRLLGAGARVLTGPQLVPPGLPVIEKLNFEVWVRRASDEATRLSDLGFDAPHPRFWGDLQTDEQLYSEEAYGQPAGVTDAGRVALTFDKQRIELGQDAGEQRFPLAGAGPRRAVYFPIGMTGIPVNYLPRLRTAKLPLERDGLSKFEAGLFLDGELVEPGTTALGEQADFIRYTSPRPRALRGAHAAFGIEEATIISIPDAIHRGWERAPELGKPVAKPSDHLERPEWWHWLDCKDREYKGNKYKNGYPLEPKPERGFFISCNADALQAPELISEDPDSSGSFTLQWSLGSPPAAVPSDTGFILEQATVSDFSDAEIIYAGGDDSYTLYGRAPGEYFYRVRVESKCKTSDWSNGVGVRVTEVTGFVQTATDAYSSRMLLAVHRALLRMCAARGDMFAVLSMPGHYREDDAEAYVKMLKSPSAAAIEVKSRFRVRLNDTIESRLINALSMPLSGGEAADYSYAAIYHPWMIGGDESDRFSGNPPDGAACGVIAARALTRGAWIAPANEAMRGPVALTPRISSERWLDLQEAQINIIRQDARGFMSMSADTLSEDDDVRPINVRRLLSLLRRLALRLGARYVFEPNDASFRRSVQRGFEAMLGQMFVRGAFAGATPQTSFQVVTAESLNTPQSVDQGRFIVELRVAPSLPMTFVTIRLVQTGDRTFVLETR